MGHPSYCKGEWRKEDEDYDKKNYCIPQKISNDTYVEINSEKGKCEVKFPQSMNIEIINRTYNFEASATDLLTYHC